MSLDPLIPVFSFAPNWSDSISERLEFRTDTISSYHGEAQTRSTRQAPRRGFEFAIAASVDARQQLLAKLYRYGAQQWYLPVWTDAVALDVALSSGAGEIPAATATRDYAVGSQVVLIGQRPQDFAIHEVDAFDEDSVSIVGTTAAAWPAGTLVMPARLARLDQDVSTAAFTGSYGTGRVSFAIEEPCDWTAIAPATTYRGFPVLTTRPQTVREPATTFTRDTDEHDDFIGIPYVVDPVGIPLATQTHDWWLDGRAAVAAFRSLAYAVRGKRNSLWIPTWLDDLTVNASLGSSSTALRIAWCGYTQLLQGQVNRKDLRIELKSGAVYYRRIVSASELSATQEQLNLDTSLGVAITAADVAQVSFLSLCRSDSDLFDIDWWTSDFAEVTTVWKARQHDV